MAGATGWVGSAVANGVAAADDLEIVAAVSRSHASKKLGDVLEGANPEAPIFANVEEALNIPCDVFVDFTKPNTVKQNVLAAIRRGIPVVVGTSGLSDADYADLALEAERHNVGVLAAGNFSLTAVLMQKFAEMAARHIPNFEIIDYASGGKPDAPSGTVWEMASRLGDIQQTQLQVPIEETSGAPDTRGARLNGVQVHALRLPGYIIGAEVIFGLPDERLTIRHDAGSSATPYVDGALLAMRKVTGFTGLRRGLVTVMDFD